MAKTRLTATETSGAGVQCKYWAGHNDPVTLNGKVIAQRIKGTPGITG